MTLRSVPEIYVATNPSRIATDCHRLQCLSAIRVDVAPHETQMLGGDRLTQHAHLCIPARRVGAQAADVCEAFRLVSDASASE